MSPVDQQELATLAFVRETYQDGVQQALSVTVEAVRTRYRLTLAQATQLVHQALPEYDGVTV